MQLSQGAVRYAVDVRAIGYVPQEAWIQNATFRENILFGSPLDPERYRQVIDACALAEDVSIP
jgi:ABC-type multidrug transport system fused ATPase/permease subunit